MQPVRTPGRERSSRVTQGQHMLFFLIGAYQVFIPATLVGDSTLTVKLVRIGMLLAIFLLGVRWLRWPRSGDLGASMMAFAIVFVMGAVWSGHMVLGLMYKGLFFCSVLGGVAVARAIQNERDFKIMLRHSVMACAVGVLIVLFLAVDGQTRFSKGRLVIGSLNPNFLGQSCAIFGILAGLLVYFESDKRWRFLAICVFLFAGGMTVLSGSRAAFLMLFMGSAVLIPLWLFRASGLRLTVIMTCLAVGVVAGMWATQAESQAVTFSDSLSDPSDVRAGTRLFTEAFRDNRLAVWWYGWKLYREYPIAGRGWNSDGRTWAVVQSSYMQVLIETGLIGAFLLLVFLARAGGRIFRTVRLTFRQSGKNFDVLPVMMAAGLAAILVHGLFEASLILGTTPNSVLLGFLVTRLDMHWRSEKVHQLEQWRQQQEQIRERQHEASAKPV